MDKLYTISEVAEKLNLNAKTLRRWEESGKFTPPRTLGGQRRYSLLDLQILDAIKHNTIPNSEDLLTIDQAASLFGVSPATISRWENDGRIHPLITAGITYYPRHRLLEKMSELVSSETSDRSFSASPPPPLEEPITPPITPPFSPKLTPLPRSSSNSKTLNSNPNKALTQNFHTADFIANLTITLILLLTYHLIFNPTSSFRSSSSSPTPSTPPLSGLVQGSSTSRDPSLVLLDSILDKTGGLTTKSSLTTPQLSLTPAAPPTSATPGTLYFDASSQTLKLFTTSWNDLPGPSTLKVTDSSLYSGNGTILKDKDSVTINNESLTPTSIITLTFNSDYSPAKKYWLTTSAGSFTVHTDFPVGKNAPFSYLIITPTPSPSPTPKPDLSEPSPSPIEEPSPTPPLIDEPTP
ncbi:MAG: MerR family transcriptional regulator [bacterium]